MASMNTQRPHSRNENPMDYGSTPHRHGHVTKKFVLCFDGTGNKFSGTDSDSNILKIYRMLDRNGDDQFHYYQPGIGTYITKANGSMTRTGRWERFQSWYAKAKDSAVGTSFDMHVMAGYKFLMRYYSPGDDIYFFGFSRGAYTARFLAEMLDHVGLLSAGNEEMCQFAWKTFQKWQCRVPEDKKNKKPGEKSEKHKLLEFMCAFRETFSRPVKPIRFLGLFDTVNSVPAFENAWMQRNKFPYTARSSAHVIRHAVSIDERRAKFRQDLISQKKPDTSMFYKHRHKHPEQTQGTADSHAGHGHSDEKDEHDEENRGRDTLLPPERFTNPHDTSGVRSSSRGYSNLDGNGRSGTPSMRSFEVQGTYTSGEEESEQDILEVWFPGCHADIGGGWPIEDGEVALSHVPLVWMVREAQKAGLEFDERKLAALSCCHEDAMPGTAHTHEQVPTIEVDPASPLPVDEHSNKSSGITTYTDHANILPHHQEYPDTPFHRHLHCAATQGRIHDVLQFNNGANAVGVVSWNIMEYLPFRRMDLQEDNTWKAIRWPLPKGETRDMPANAIIHSSVIKRMISDPTYRPGNLIVGGGGRGVRQAPENYGIGKWIVACEEGHPVGECFVRRHPPERTKTDETEHLASVKIMQP